MHRHKDRFSCEISTTMVGGDNEAIYIEWYKLGKQEKNGHVSEYTEGVKVELKLDMLVYKGNICEHWRILTVKVWQVFLHYNNQKQKVLKRIYLTEENI